MQTDPIVETVKDMRESADSLSVSTPAISSAMKIYADEVESNHQKQIRVLEMYLKERDQKIAILQERVRIATEALDTIVNTTKEEETGIVAGNASNRLRNRILIAASNFADIADYCKETRNLDSTFKTCALDLVRQRAERTIKAIKERKGTK